MCQLQQQIEWCSRNVRRWWNDLCLPPKPSDYFMFLTEDDPVSHTKTWTILQPQPRQDEIDFVSDDGKKIVGRQLDYTINGTRTSVDLNFDQPSFEIKGVLAGATLQSDFYNKTEDGKVGHANTRTGLAPPAPKVIPVPDAADWQFADEPDSDE